MKNKEKFAKEIVELIVNKHDVAVFNGKLVACDDINCSECDLSGNCRSGFKEWAESEYVEPRYEIDWASVPVDTPVIVHDTIGINRRYFNKKLPHGKLSIYRDGTTSWSSVLGCHASKVFEEEPKYVELAREEDKIKYRKIEGVWVWEKY